MKIVTGLALIASVIGINTGYLFAQGGWAPEVRIAPHNDIFDQRIIAKGDSIHIVYWGDNMEIFYIRSFDNGNTWSQPFNLDNPSISGYNHSPDIISIGDTILGTHMDYSISVRRNSGKWPV